jgi:hypothetical protein
MTRFLSSSSLKSDEAQCREDPFFAAACPVLATENPVSAKPMPFTKERRGLALCDILLLALPCPMSVTKQRINASADHAARAQVAKTSKGLGWRGDLD